jgi:hypothetical protein
MTSQILAYVTGTGDGTVKVIDVALQQVIAVIQIPGPTNSYSGPGEIAITGNGAYACVVVGANGTVTAIDTTEMLVAWTVDIPPDLGPPNGIAASSDGKFVYVLSTNSVSAIDTTQQKLVWTTSFNGTTLGGEAIAVTRDGRYVFILVGEMVVINTINHRVVDQISIPGWAIAMTPNGNAALVVGPNSSGPEEGGSALTGFLYVIATGEGAPELVSTTPLALLPMTIAISPDGNYAYVAFYEGRYAAINTATLEIEWTVDVDSPAGGLLVVSPDGHFVYCLAASQTGQYFGQLVYVIDVAQRKLIKTIALGSYAGAPAGIAMWSASAPGKRFAQLAGDMDGDGLDEILVSGEWGIAILKQSHHEMKSLASVANGVRIGGWLLDTANNNFSLVANFDNSDRASIFVTSPWGIAILKFESGKLVELASVHNGTRLGHWALDSTSDVFGPVADFDGDGQSEVLVTSRWGLGVLKYSSWSFTSITMVANGTNMAGWTLDTAQDLFGATADFNNGGQDQIFVTSPLGVTFLTLASSATATSSGLTPNGTDLGGWKLETSNNVFGQVGNYITLPPAFASPPQLFVSSPWGIAVLAPLTALAVFPNGQLPGGWNLEAGASVFGPTADYDGDSHDEILVTSSSGIAVLSFGENNNVQDGTSSFEVEAETVVFNGNSVGAWSLDTRTNSLGAAANYSPSYGQPILGESLQGPVQAGVFVTSPWGIGILKFAVWQGVSSPMMQQNGASFGPLLQPDGTHSGDWTLDTTHDQF